MEGSGPPDLGQVNTATCSSSRPPGRVRFVVPLLATSLAVAAVTGAYGDTDRRGGKHGHHEGKRAHHRSIELPDRLDLPDGWQPEGIAAGRGSDLYVGSIPTGAVLRLDARTGETTPVVAAQTGRAAIGLKLDKRGRLFVAGGRPARPSSTTRGLVPTSLSCSRRCPAWRRSSTTSR